MPEENMSRNAPEPVIPLEYHPTLEPPDRGVQVLWKPYNQVILPIQRLLQY